MLIAQILHGRVHWIFNADSIPNLPLAPEGNPIVLIDITSEAEVKEGWNYNNETGEFTPPEIIESETVVETTPTSNDIAEETLLETKYQTLLLEMML